MVSYHCVSVTGYGGLQGPVLKQYDHF